MMRCVQSLLCVPPSWKHLSHRLRLRGAFPWIRRLTATCDHCCCSLRPGCHWAALAPPLPVAAMFIDLESYVGFSVDSKLMKKIPNIMTLGNCKLKPLGMPVLNLFADPFQYALLLFFIKCIKRLSSLRQYNAIV
ncbi:hypothetical protein ROHU_027198 [Labeo rohita]|uniref:Uncharacterized protein n=1 Tax=Labeo rohita TaxID=84645 RepID=A0A498M7T5_LABRO|nr:hypothetical protein ROHU_027198 [Labeo rohita]